MCTSSLRNGLIPIYVCVTERLLHLPIESTTAATARACSMRSVQARPSIQASSSQSKSTMVVTRSLLLSHSVRPIFWVPSVLRSNPIVKPTTTSTEPRRARAKSSFYEDFKTHLTDESRSPRKRQHWIYASTKSSTGNGRIIEESDESQEDDADLKASIAAPP
jgi:hypothetical protein